MKDESISSVCIESDDTILNALQLLEKNNKKFLIVKNSSKVMGILVDGDIRRALISGKSLNNSLDGIYNYAFEFLSENSTFNDVCEKFKSNKIDFLPILNKNMELINIITKKQFHIMLLDNIRFCLTLDFEKFDNNNLEYEIYNRPWGFYKSTILTPHAQSKIITIFPGEELSLQKHKQREEHWIIIKGNGVIVLGESNVVAHPGKYVFIPKGCKHKIINDGDENIILSEVQLGDYFGEDDIIRYADKYGRV